MYCNNIAVHFILLYRIASNPLVFIPPITLCCGALIVHALTFNGQISINRVNTMWVCGMGSSALTAH